MNIWRRRRSAITRGRCCSARSLICMLGKSEDATFDPLSLLGYLPVYVECSAACR